MRHDVAFSRGREFVLLFHYLLLAFLFLCLCFVTLFLVWSSGLSGYKIIPDAHSNELAQPGKGAKGTTRARPEWSQSSACTEEH